MKIEDHTSGCVAHMTVLVEKLWFLGKSRSNPLCMGEWVGCGCCLARLSVEFRKLSNTWKLLGTSSHMGEYFGKLWFWCNGGTKTVKNFKFPAGIAYMRAPCSGWFSPSHVEFRELAA